jgi:hypothetical protein
MTGRKKLPRNDKSGWPEMIGEVAKDEKIKRSRSGVKAQGIIPLYDLFVPPPRGGMDSRMTKGVWPATGITEYKKQRV